MDVPGRQIWGQHEKEFPDRQSHQKIDRLLISFGMLK